MIYAARTAAGLTQKELARRIGTSQSVIARLEDADYKGHSLSMLRRIADALDLAVDINLRPKQKNTYRPVFVEAPAPVAIKFVTQRPSIDIEAYRPRASEIGQGSGWSSMYRQVQSG